MQTLKYQNLISNYLTFTTGSLPISVFSFFESDVLYTSLFFLPLNIRTVLHFSSFVSLSSPKSRMLPPTTTLIFPSLHPLMPLGHPFAAPFLPFLSYFSGVNTSLAFLCSLLSSVCTPSVPLQSLFPCSFLFQLLYSSSLFQTISLLDVRGWRQTDFMQCISTKWRQQNNEKNIQHHVQEVDTQTDTYFLLFPSRIDNKMCTEFGC